MRWMFLVFLSTILLGSFIFYQSYQPSVSLGINSAEVLNLPKSQACVDLPGLTASEVAMGCNLPSRTCDSTNLLKRSCTTNTQSTCSCVCNRTGANNAYVWQCTACTSGDCEANTGLCVNTVASESSK